MDHIDSYSNVQAHLCRIVIVSIHFPKRLEILTCKNMGKVHKIANFASF